MIGSGKFEILRQSYFLPQNDGTILETGLEYGAFRILMAGKLKFAILPEHSELMAIVLFPLKFSKIFISLDFWLPFVSRQMEESKPPILPGIMGCFAFVNLGLSMTV